MPQNNQSNIYVTQIQYRLIIKTATWSRDSHGLFDYEGKDTDKKQMKAYGTCIHSFIKRFSFKCLVAITRHE